VSPSIVHFNGIFHFQDYIPLFQEKIIIKKEKMKEK